MVGGIDDYRDTLSELTVSIVDEAVDLEDSGLPWMSSFMNGWIVKITEKIVEG